MRSTKSRRGEKDVLKREKVDDKVGSNCRGGERKVADDGKKR